MILICANPLASKVYIILCFFFFAIILQKFRNIDRCVTKIQNFAGKFGPYWVQKKIFTKIGGTKKIHGPNSRGTSRIKYNFNFCESILMQDSVLETLLVEYYTIKISAQNFWNFIVKFGPKSEICWKLEELK